MPDTDIRIAEDKSGVKVAADRFDSRMQTLPREDFPTLPESGGGADRRRCRAAALKEMVAKTQFAITGEDTRYFLNGALFVLRPRLDEPGRHRRPSSGAGHREARRQAAKDEDEEIKADPSEENARRARRGCSTEGDGDISYERGENHLFFDVGGRLLISRMIDGQFPAYERVIPKGNDKHIEFERDRLTNAVKRVALLSNERSRAVKFQIDKGKVDVTSSSPGSRRGAGDAAGRLHRGADADLLQRAVRARLSRGRRDRRRRARAEGRSQPGGDEAGRRRRATTTPTSSCR